MVAFTRCAAPDKEVAGATSGIEHSDATETTAKVQQRARVVGAPHLEASPLRSIDQIYLSRLFIADSSGAVAQRLAKRLIFTLHKNEAVSCVDLVKKQQASQRDHGISITT